MFVLFLVHYLGIFPITHMADHFGEYIMAAVIIGDITSLLWYLVGLVWELDPRTGNLIFRKSKDPEDQPTGYVIYDFFMGTILYPRYVCIIKIDTSILQ